MGNLQRIISRLATPQLEESVVEADEIWAQLQQEDQKGLEIKDAIAYKEIVALYTRRILI